jgi:hypothetical protein
VEIPNGLVKDENLQNLVDLKDDVGRGSTREVFGVVGAPDLVIKRSHVPFHYSNFVEWTIWNAVQGMTADDIMGHVPNPSLIKIFAKVLAISHSAEFLLMERLQPLSDTSAILHSKFPKWLSDKKPSAFGVAKDGEIKVMDYGMINFYDVLNPLNSKSLF